MDYRLVAETMTFIETAGRGIGWRTGGLYQQQSATLGPYFLFHTAEQRSANALSLRLPRGAEPVQVESALSEGMGAVAGKTQCSLSITID